MGDGLGVTPPRWAGYRQALQSWARSPFSRANVPATIATMVLLVGLALRIWSTEQARFSGEEAWFWSIGRDIATGTSFPVLGHPITGSSARHPGAGFFYFLGLTQLAGPSPLAAYVAVSLGGWVALALLSLAIARAFDRATGLAFLLLGTVSPWWVVYTNSAWPGYLLPTLCALVLICLASIADRPAAGVAARAGLAFLLVIGFQIHLSLLHTWLITMVVFALLRPRLGRAFLIGAVIGVACYVPYLIDEIRHGFSNTLAIAHRSQGGARSIAGLAGLLFDFVAFATTDVSYLWKQGFWRPFDPFAFYGGRGVAETAGFMARGGPAPIGWAALAVSWAFTVGAWIWFAATIRRRLRTGARTTGNLLVVACLVAVAAIPLLYLLSGKGGYPHYVNAVLPLALLPPALALGKLLAHRAARWGAVAYLILFAAGGFFALRGYYAVDSRWSVPQSTAAVAFILERTREPDGHQRPFRLEFGFGPSFPNSYALLAKHVFHAPFLATGAASDTFRVDARAPDQPAPAETDSLVLSTIVVRHLRQDDRPR
ncbi:MAG TPA: hypothetical protein VIF57_18920 [Polyangia bacterium]